jgi:hypothetical protein
MAFLKVDTSELSAFRKRFAAKMKRLPKVVERSVSGGEARVRMLQIGLHGLASVVYSKPEGRYYVRTNDLLNSCVVIKSGASATLTLDSKKSRAEGAPHSVSYGYFFLGDVDTYLNYAQNPHYPKRDFVEVWSRDIRAWLPQHVKRDVIMELAK